MAIISKTDQSTPEETKPASLRVCVVGSGTRFLSGISVYTIRLGDALSSRHRVSIVTLRRLLPARWYPGRDRVGRDLGNLRPGPGVDRFDGIDWYWLPSMLQAVLFAARRRPQVVILQWWTGTVLHTYLLLSLIARVARIPIIVEFHEVIDTGEARIAFVRRYVAVIAPLVLRLASGFAVHSAFDRDLLLRTYRLGRRRPVAILPHGPHDHYLDRRAESGVAREAPPTALNLLHFGIIRPYKGLEVLVRAFDSIPKEQIQRYWLTVVGETWEGWDLPIQLIEASRYRDRITLVNRYVSDDELDGYLRSADAVMLPYLRSSLSGPLHVAMGYGLPIVMSDVGGNAEAGAGYGGLNLVPPGDEAALRAAIERLPSVGDARYQHPHSWDHTAEAYERLFASMGLSTPGAR